MADTLTIAIQGALADEIRAAAEARGLSPEEYVRQQLSFDVAMTEGLGADGVEEDIAAADEFERTGVGVAWEEVREWMSSWGTDNERPRPTPRKLR